MFALHKPGKERLSEGLEAIVLLSVLSGLVSLPLLREGGANDSVQPSSEAENYLGSGTHEHPTHHCTSHLIPVETERVHGYCTEHQLQLPL